MQVQFKEVEKGNFIPSFEDFSPEITAQFQTFMQVSLQNDQNLQLLLHERNRKYELILSEKDKIISNLMAEIQELESRLFEIQKSWQAIHTEEEKKIEGYETIVKRLELLILELEKQSELPNLYKLAFEKTAALFYRFQESLPYSVERSKKYWNLEDAIHEFNAEIHKYPNENFDILKNNIETIFSRYINSYESYEKNDRYNQRIAI